MNRGGMVSSDTHNYIIQKEDNDYLSKALALLRNGKAPQVTQAINNIIRSRYLSRGGIEGCDFSGLDLHGVNIASYINGHESKIPTKFDNAYVERKNFFIDGSADSLYCAFFNSDNKYVVTTSEDGKVCIWESETGYLRNTYDGGGEGNSFLFSHSIFHPSEPVVAVACNDGRVVLLNSETCEEIADIIIHEGIKTHIAGTRQLNFLDFSNDGRLISVASNDSNVYIIDVFERIVLKTLYGHTDSVATVKFNCDGTKLVSSSSDGYVIVWNVGDGQIIKKYCCYDVDDVAIYDYSKPCLFADISPDNKYVYAATNNHLILRWSLCDNSAVPHALHKLDTVSEYIAFSPIGNEFAVATCESDILIFDSISGKIIKQFQCVGNNKKSAAYTTVISSVDYDSTGTKILIATDSGDAFIHSANRFDLITSISGHISTIRRMCVNSDINNLATATDDGYVFIWNLTNGKLENLLFDTDKFVTDLSYSNNNKHFLSSALGGKAYLYNIETEYTIVNELIHSQAVASTVDSAEFSPNSELAITSSYNDNNICVWDSSTGKLLNTIVLPSPVFSSEFSNDSRYVLASGTDNIVYVFDLMNNKMVCELRGHTDRVTYSKFNGNDKIIVSASLDNTAIVWDFETGNIMSRLKGHNEKINNIVLNDNSRELATVDKYTVRIWDIFSGKIIRKFGNTRKPALDVDFSGDGSMFVIMYDCEIIVFDTTKMKKIISFSDNDTSFDFCVFAEDDKIFVSAEKQYIYVYDTNIQRQKSSPVFVFNHNYNPKFEGCTFDGTKFDNTFTERDIHLLRSYAKGGLT